MQFVWAFAVLVCLVKEKSTLLSGHALPLPACMLQNNAKVLLISVVVVAFPMLVRILGECSTIHSPPALFFEVQINSRTLIPLFRPGSAHSYSASWNDSDRVFPGVGQYIAIHATLTAKDFFLAYFYPSGPFTCIFSKTSPDFFCVGCGLTHGSCLGPQKKKKVTLPDAGPVLSARGI